VIRWASSSWIVGYKGVKKIQKSYKEEEVYRYVEKERNQVLKETKREKCEE